MSFKKKVIEFQNILQTDFIPDFAKKINTADNTLRNELVALYNNLCIDLDTVSGSIGTQENPLHGVTTNGIKICGNKEEDGIYFISTNSGSSAAGADSGYMKFNANGGIDAKFENIDIANINVTDGDLSFGDPSKATKKNDGSCDVSIYGSLNVDGPTSYTIDSVENDNLIDGVYNINDDTRSLVVFNNNDGELTLNFEIGQPEASGSDVIGQVPAGASIKMLFENACSVTLKNAHKFPYNEGGSDSDTESPISVAAGSELNLIVIDTPKNTAEKYFVVYVK